jgi:hypothetical protein
MRWARRVYPHWDTAKVGDNSRHAVSPARNSCVLFFRRYGGVPEGPRGNFDQSFVSCP